MCIPAYTDTAYWHEYVLRAHEIRLLKGRLKFLDNGKPADTARFPSAIVIFKHIGGVCQKQPHIWHWDWSGKEEGFSFQVEYKHFDDDPTSWAMSGQGGIQSLGDIVKLGQLGQYGLAEYGSNDADFKFNKLDTDSMPY
jgi:hypothetical protein